MFKFWKKKFVDGELVLDVVNVFVDVVLVMV